MFEAYFSGEDGRNGFIDDNENYLHDLRSATKSITSILVGIAFDQKYLSLDNTLNKYFNNLIPNDNYRIGDVTILQLLTMTSGIGWNQSGMRKKGDVDSETEMESSKKPIEYILSKKIVFNPGEQFDYNSGNTVLLGKIVENATGQDLDKFAKENLFKPLGIVRYCWWDKVNDVYWTHAGLRMKAMDIFKIGQMMLSNGEYQNKKVLSKIWIDESIKLREKHPGYGFQWWRKSFQGKSKKYHSYFAAGNGGQYIFIFPLDDMVVVFSGGNYHSELQGQPNEIIQKEIIPSIEF